MGFILKELDTYLHVKLTDEGRKKIAEGNFNPTKFSVGDSEIDYKYYRENNRNIEESMVLSPKDNNPKIKHVIPSKIDDTVTQYNIASITTNKKVIQKAMPELGFFDGIIYDNSLKIQSQYIKQPHLQINMSQLTTSNNNVLRIVKTDQYGPIVSQIVVGDYLLVGWANQLVTNNDFKLGIINPDRPLPYLWYKITAVTGDIDLGTLDLTLDKYLPNYGATPTGTSYAYVFPKLNSAENFYNTNNIREYWQSGFFDFTDTCNTSPRNPYIWNMDILFTERIIGITNDLRDNRYFNSSAYAGFITYLYEVGHKFKNIGIIHFSNLYPDKSFGEELVATTIELLLPTIILNQNTANRIGTKLISGITLKTISDGLIEYYDLLDTFGNVYGKILHKLKVIVIEDQELLFAMSYKSNRNWTFPKQLNNFNIGFGC